MKTLPAVVVGGPPNSGKSVLTYSLTQALRQLTPHFVVRAAPDGEGDWSSEAHLETVKLLRQRAKGDFTDAFVNNVCNALQTRHLPLIVDVGGRISKEQKRIVNHCTHMIILSSDASELVKWREFAVENKLTIIAELHSTLDEDEEVFTDGSILSGRIRGLIRGNQASGPLFVRLISRLEAVFAVPDSDLRDTHIASAPSEPLEFDELAKKLKVEGGTWLPAHLAQLDDHFVARMPRSIYGRGPNWLYGALAAQTYPATLHQFDSLLGWIQPIQPNLSTDAEPNKLTWSIRSEPEEFFHLSLKIAGGSYLNYAKAKTIKLPPHRNDKGLIIGGRLPQWLYTGLVYCYHDAPILAIYQPQIGAVIVKSASPEWPVGQVLPVSD